MALITRHSAEAGSKLILVGDDRQLASIDRGGMFGALREEHGAAELAEVTRTKDADQQRAFNLMHEGKFAPALEIFDQRGAIQWEKTQDDAMHALLGRVSQDMQAEPDKTRFIFAYTNADVDKINDGVRAMRRERGERGELGEDHQLKTSRGVENYAAGDRIQFRANAYHREAKEAGLANGVVGTVQEIDGRRVTVALDVPKGDDPRSISFTVGDNARAGEFNGFSHGYAGTIYKGQGETLDQSYLYHSAHWRAASGYVALTRHREETALFVATDTARDIAELAKQMGRVDERRAASQFVIATGAMQAPAQPVQQAAEAIRPAAQEITARPPEKAPEPVQAPPVATSTAEPPPVADPEQTAATHRIAARIAAIADPMAAGRALFRQHMRDAARRKGPPPVAVAAGAEGQRPVDLTEQASAAPADVPPQADMAQPQARADMGQAAGQEITGRTPEAAPQAAQPVPAAPTPAAPPTADIPPPVAADGRKTVQDEAGRAGKQVAEQKADTGPEIKGEISQSRAERLGRMLGTYGAAKAATQGRTAGGRTPPAAERGQTAQDDGRRTDDRAAGRKAEAGPDIKGEISEARAERLGRMLGNAGTNRPPGQKIATGPRGRTR